MKRIVFSIVCAAAIVCGPVGGRAFAAQGTAAKATDVALSERIEARLHADARLKNQTVKVSAVDGVVTLTGTVASKAQKKRAAALARVNGVTRVDNRIEVGTAKGPIGTAAEKTKEGTVKAIDKAKEGTEKAVDKTKEGAEKAVEKGKEGTATGLAKSGQGVKRAASEITDAFLLSAVKARFVGEDVMKGSDINVDCDKHVVTLRGTVPTAAARARAIELAKKTDGVERVVDRLTIGPKKD